MVKSCCIIAGDDIFTVELWNQTPAAPFVRSKMTRITADMSSPGTHVWCLVHLPMSATLHKRETLVEWTLDQVGLRPKGMRSLAEIDLKMTTRSGETAVSSTVRTENSTRKNKQKTEIGIFQRHPKHLPEKKKPANLAWQSLRRTRGHIQGTSQLCLRQFGCTHGWWIEIIPSYSDLMVVWYLKVFALNFKNIL